jgi:amino-acid N-acetyltransferase
LVEAGKADFEAIKRLLQEAGLPLDGVGEAEGTYLVTREGGAVIGCVGLEVYGVYGLLRSLAVSPERRGQGVGTALTRRALELAREKGLRRVFLLTMTAEAFFTRFGFAPLPREEAPAEIRGSAELSWVCPDTVILMAWEAV